MAEFTPGPWEVTESLDHNDNPCVAVTGFYGEAIYENVCADVTDRANAHLTAAAPDLYEALNKVFGTEKMTFANMGDFNLWFNERGKEARAALAKARGEK